MRRFAAGLVKYPTFFSSITGILVLAIIHALFFGSTLGFSWPEKFLRFALHLDVFGHGVSNLLRGPGGLGVGVAAGACYIFNPHLHNLVWPSLRTIQSYIPKIKVSNAVSKEQIAEFAIRVKANLMSGATRFIRIGCDEVHCTEGLWFVGTEVIGAVDGHHDMEASLSMDRSELANQSMVFRIKDLSGNVSANCGLFATRTMTGDEIFAIVLEIAAELQKHGLKAIVFTGDCSQANLHAMERLDSSFDRFGIFTFACYVHVFKLIRNPLLTTSGESLERVDDGPITVDFIQRHRVLFPHVTNEVLTTTDKMKVDPALELLNYEVAKTLLQQSTMQANSAADRQKAGSLGVFALMATLFWQMFDVRCTSKEQLDPLKPNKPVLSLHERKAMAVLVLSYFGHKSHWVKHLSDAATKSIVRDCTNLIKLIDFLSAQGIADKLKTRVLCNDDLENIFSIFRSISAVFSVAQLEQMYPRVSMIAMQREAGYQVCGYHPVLSRHSNAASSRREAESVGVSAQLPSLKRAAPTPTTADAKQQQQELRAKKAMVKDLTRVVNPGVLPKHSEQSLRNAFSRMKPNLSKTAQSHSKLASSSSSATSAMVGVTSSTAAAATDEESGVWRYICPWCEKPYASKGSHFQLHVRTWHLAKLKGLGEFEHAWEHEVCPKIVYKQVS